LPSIKIAILTIILFCTAVGQSYAGRRHYYGPARSEVELMGRVLDCLNHKDSIGYYNLFPPFDSLWKLVMHNPDQTPEMQQQIAELKEHPSVLIDLDPFYNHTIMGRFSYMLRKGEDSGVHWGELVIQRYEMHHAPLTKGMEGLQSIMPERFNAYLFVRDMAASTTFCITMTEIQKIDGFYYGGQLINVLEANTVDQFMSREAGERLAQDKAREEHQRLADSARVADSVRLAGPRKDTAGKHTDSTAAGAKTTGTDTSKSKRTVLLSVAPQPDDDASKNRHEVVDRRYYSGKFDDEIPVKLYVRYMKDAGGKVNGWDALYKFGDMEQYVKLDVTKTKEGVWLFEEPVATMELELNDKTYTGSWTQGEDQTGYDVELTEKPLSEEKRLMLDKILETGTWGKTDQQPVKEAPPPPDHDTQNNNPD